MAKITKEDFDSLYSNDDITKKRYDEIVGEISERLCEIVKDLDKYNGKGKSFWFDYDNGHDETDGHFDPNDYKEDIGIDGC